MKSSAADAISVLVVDDDSALIRTLSDILRLHGYNPDTAATAAEALRHAGNRTPALAVVDLRLPDMDGMELVSRLRSLSELTEVVVLTGNASVESAVAALRENSVDYLVKPVQVEKLLQVVSVATERFQRRHAESALRDSEERHRLLFDRNPQPVWVCDRESLRFLAVNDAAIRHYAYSRDEFMRMTIEDVCLEENFTAMRIPATADTPLLRHHRKNDAAFIDVEVAMHDIVFAGRPARIMLSLDITERLAAHRALETRARQQAAVAACGTRALAVDDPAVLIREALTLVSATLEVPFVTILERRSDGTSVAPSTWLGWPVGAMEKIVVPITEESQMGYTLLRHEPVIIENLRTDQRFPGTQVLSRLGVVSGVTVVIPGAVHAFGVLAAHDKRARNFTQDDVHFLQAIAHIVGTTIDRSRTEMALRQGQRLEAVGRLAGGVAHDFNNMLTAITGYAELLRMHEGDVQAMNGDIDEILKAARRAAGLTRQLLAFSRQQVLQPRAVDLGAVVTNMEGMLRRLITENIEFVMALDPKLDVVKADPGQLEQVILNLCVNARDAMPDGGTLTIETANVELDDADSRAHDGVEPGSYVMLAVTDTGVGMDADTKARIYEPFFTTKPADQGTGLGLPTVYGIVKQSGGEIWVYSEVGMGTTFKIFLPRAEAAVETPVVAAPSRARAMGTETVLLAEDEEAVRTLAHRLLTKAGYSVLVAGTGTEAAKLSEDHRGEIHLLVTDMVMPAMNGPELATLLRRSRPELRVLYLSGYTDVTVARQGLLQNGASFLQKPFTGESLATRVREALDTSAT